MSTVTEELKRGGGYILGRIRAFRPQVSLLRGVYRCSLRYLSTRSHLAPRALGRSWEESRGGCTRVPPKSDDKSKSRQQYIGHRHPGSTYVYAIKGTLRLGIEGQPVQLVHAGQRFFEPLRHP